MIPGSGPWKAGLIPGLQAEFESSTTGRKKNRLRGAGKKKEKTEGRKHIDNEHATRDFLNIPQPRTRAARIVFGS
ncbi:uncharacterized protein LOC144763165 isoform X2 [Lissotriton helveticus]